MFITLPGVNPPADRPKIDILDPILPSAGALLLIDPKHEISPWAFSGVPADLTLLPNLAEDQANALGILQAKPVFNYTPSAGVLVGERTSKGGLHAILAAANAAADGLGMGIGMSSDMGAYLLANPTHTFYFSAWLRATRARTDTSGLTTAPVFAVTNSATDANNRLVRVIAGGITTGVSPVGSRQINFGTGLTGPQYFDVAVNAWGGTLPSTPSSMARHVFRVGRPVSGTSPGGAYASDPANPGGPSYAFYRAYVEDLTVSGRSYATVSALDFAAYTREVLTAGGRYYDDTFTDPATLP